MGFHLDRDVLNDGILEVGPIQEIERLKVDECDDSSFSRKLSETLCNTGKN